MLCPYLLISINELLISIISFIDINKYGLNVKTAAHTGVFSPPVYPSRRAYRTTGTLPSLFRALLSSAEEAPSCGL